MSKKKKPTKRVRIAVVMHPNGEWGAFGEWHMNDEQKREGTFLNNFSEPGAEQYFFVEADVPVPQTITGKVA